MPTTSATSKKRKLGDELPQLFKRRQPALRQEIVSSIARDGRETMLKLLDSKYHDVVIKCQGRELGGCGAVLAARCKFFEACLAGGFKESGSRVIEMNDDDPDALEAFIQYLHTSDTMHIENWNISYENRPLDKDDPQDDNLSFALYSKPYGGELPLGYLPFLANVCILADKYEQPWLGHAVALMFAIRPGQKEFAPSLDDNDADNNNINEGLGFVGDYDDLLVEEVCMSRERYFEIRDAYTKDPVDAFKALAILSRLPATCEAKFMAEQYLMDFLDQQDLIKFPMRICSGFDADDPELPKANELVKDRLKTVIAEDPAVFFSLAEHYQDLCGTRQCLRSRIQRLEKENKILREGARPGTVERVRRSVGFQGVRPWYEPQD